MPRQKLNEAAIAGDFDEFVSFAQANAATVAARDGTDALTSLRQHHSQEKTVQNDLYNFEIRCITLTSQLADVFRSHMTQGCLFHLAYSSWPPCQGANLCLQPSRAYSTNS